MPFYFFHMATVGAGDPEPMVPYQLVNDFAGIFTDAGNRA